MISKLITNADDVTEKKIRRGVDLTVIQWPFLSIENELTRTAMIIRDDMNRAKKCVVIISNWFRKPFIFKRR